MTRMSKQGKRRARDPHRNQAPAVKTGPLKDNLPKGYKEHANALAGTTAEKQVFIPQIKAVKK